MYCIIKMNLPDGNTTAEKIDESVDESVDNVEVSRISSESAINAADTLLQFVEKGQISDSDELEMPCEIFVNLKEKLTKKK